MIAEENFNFSLNHEENNGNSNNPIPEFTGMGPPGNKAIERLKADEATTNTKTRTITFHIRLAKEKMSGGPIARSAMGFYFKSCMIKKNLLRKIRKKSEKDKAISSKQHHPFQIVLSQQQHSGHLQNDSQ